MRGPERANGKAVGKEAKDSDDGEQLRARTVGAGAFGLLGTDYTVQTRPAPHMPPVHHRQEDTMKQALQSHGRAGRGRSEGDRDVTFLQP
jgi:hypothetical protein